MRYLVVTFWLLVAASCAAFSQQPPPGESEASQSQQPVFATWDDKPRQPDGLSKESSEAMRDIGLPHVTQHTLRHTHASQLITSGMDILTVSRRLGHSSPAITLTVYGHLLSPADRAAEIMQATFAKSGLEG